MGKFRNVETLLFYIYKKKKKCWLPCSLFNSYFKTVSSDPVSVSVSTSYLSPPELLVPMPLSSMASSVPLIKTNATDNSWSAIYLPSLIMEKILSNFQHNIKTIECDLSSVSCGPRPHRHRNGNFHWLTENSGNLSTCRLRQTGRVWAASWHGVLPS